MNRIIPLKQAEITVPLSVVMMMGDARFLSTGPVYVWVIEGEEKLVVDAGIEEPQDGKVKGFLARGGGERGLREALNRVNLKPEDVEKLVITHLHFDHAGIVELFHNARIYVQKREWESAFNPPMHYRKIYDEKMLSKIESMDLCLVNGDLEIAEGIKLVLLPGHTKGLQGIAVETDKGRYLLAGDHFYTFLNFFPPKQSFEITDSEGNRGIIIGTDQPFLPPGLHVDLSEWFESCFKALSYVKKANIIPGHDPSIEGRTFP